MNEHEEVAGAGHPDDQEHQTLKWYQRRDGVSTGAPPTCPICGNVGDDFCPHCGQWFCVAHSGMVTFDWMGETRAVQVCREGFDRLASEVPQ